MRVVASNVDEDQNRRVLQDFYGSVSKYDEYLVEFDSGDSFDLEGSIYEITGSIATNNNKGNLLIKKDGIHFMNMMLTLSDTFLVILRVSPKNCLEIIVSE